MGAIQVATGEPFQRARQWVNLDPIERKLRATEAARDRDAAVLWALAEARLLLHGAQGARLSPHTAKAYRLSVTQLLRGFSAYNLLHPPADAAVLWLRSMEAEGKSAATIRVRLAAARAIYAGLRWAEATDADPFADAHPALDRTPAWDKRRPYDDADIERMLTVADPHDRVLVLLGAHAGLRIAEALALTWPDIDLARRRLTVQSGKGGKRRTPPLSRSLVEALRSIEQPTGRLFPYTTAEQARAHLRDLCTRAGVRYLGAHALRHSAGTRLYRETGKLEHCQRLLGHANLNTTLVYAHFGDDAVADSLADW